jgi:hypothetical protein
MPHVPSEAPQGVAAAGGTQGGSDTLHANPVTGDVSPEQSPLPPAGEQPQQGDWTRTETTTHPARSRTTNGSNLLMPKSCRSCRRTAPRPRKPCSGPCSRTGWPSPTCSRSSRRTISTNAPRSSDGANTPSRAATASGITTPRDAWIAGPSASEARQGRPRSAANRLATVLLPTPGAPPMPITLAGRNAWPGTAVRNPNGPGRYYLEWSRKNAPPELPVRFTEHACSCAWPTPSHRIRAPDRRPGPQRCRVP